VQVSVTGQNCPSGVVRPNFHCLEAEACRRVLDSFALAAQFGSRRYLAISRSAASFLLRKSPVRFSKTRASNLHRARFIGHSFASIEAWWFGQRAGKRSWRGSELSSPR
jgi:hypothetical protein